MDFQTDGESTDHGETGGDGVEGRCGHQETDALAGMSGHQQVRMASHIFQKQMTILRRHERMVPHDGYLRENVSNIWEGMGYSIRVRS